MRKPTSDEIRRAVDKSIPDAIGYRLRILFCGINPGLYSAAAGHHFARPGNRFWPTLHRAGLTPRQLAPDEEPVLLALGLGITNIVDRASARAGELTAEELIAGAQRLREKVLRYQPHVLAILGISAYRTAFCRPKAVLGRQQETIGDTVVWVLPNPSGLNAHFQLADLAEWFSKLIE